MDLGWQDQVLLILDHEKARSVRSVDRRALRARGWWRRWCVSAERGVGLLARSDRRARGPLRTLPGEPDGNVAAEPVVLRAIDLARHQHPPRRRFHDCRKWYPSAVSSLSVEIVVGVLNRLNRPRVVRESGSPNEKEFGRIIASKQSIERACPARLRSTKPRRPTGSKPCKKTLRLRNNRSRSTSSDSSLFHRTGTIASSFAVEPCTSIAPVPSSTSRIRARSVVTR